MTKKDKKQHISLAIQTLINRFCSTRSLRGSSSPIWTIRVCKAWSNMTNPLKSSLMMNNWSKLWRISNQSPNLWPLNVWKISWIPRSAELLTLNRLKKRSLNRRREIKGPRHQEWARLETRCFLRTNSYKKALAKIRHQPTSLHRPKLHQPSWMMSIPNLENHCARSQACRLLSPMKSNRRTINAGNVVGSIWGRLPLLPKQVVVGSIMPNRSWIPESFLTFQTKMLSCLTQKCF